MPVTKETTERQASGMAKAIGDEIAKGDIVLYQSYAKVLSRYDHGYSVSQLHLQDLDTGKDYYITGKELIDRCHSTDLYTEEEKVCKTRMIEELLKAGDKPVTVFFIKKDGEERRLRGRWIKWLQYFGSSLMEDLDIPEGENRFREVKHESIQWIILDGKCWIRK